MSFEKYVPEEAAGAWNIVIKPQLTMMASGYQPAIDIEKIDPDSRLSFKLMSLKRERAEMALGVLPKLFSESYNGPELRNLWEKIQDSELYTPWSFICAVAEAYTAPHDISELMTERERSAWEAKVVKKTYELRSLIISSRYDNALDSVMHELLSQVDGAIRGRNSDFADEIKTELASIFSVAPSLSEHLHYLAVEQRPDWVELRGWGKRNLQFIKKPNDKDAHRYFFIRYMTNFFGEATGSPQRSIVSAVVSHLFGDINSRKVVEIAPWLSQGGD